MLQILKFFMLTFLVIVALPSWAQTPDGNTPANEGVCDDLIGGTPGLYGLCIGYCEARDLNKIGSDISKPSNSKLLTIYNKKKQVGDPDMPCVQSPCSCWSDSEISATTWGSRSSAPRCTITATNGSATEGTFNSGQDRKDAAAQVRTDGFRCVYNDQSAGVMREFNINQDEFNTCHAQVVQLCTDLGL